MTREELKNAGLNDEQIETVMKLHGQGINDANARAEQASEQVRQLTTDLEAARNSTELADMRDKLNRMTGNYNALRKSNAIKAALAEYRPRDAAMLAKLLDNDKIAFDEEKGTVTGVKEQVEPLKSSSGYLFADTPAPAGGTPGGDNNNGDGFSMNRFLRGE